MYLFPLPYAAPCSPLQGQRLAAAVDPPLARGDRITRPDARLCGLPVRPFAGRLFAAARRAFARLLVLPAVLTLGLGPTASAQIPGSGQRPETPQGPLEDPIDRLEAHLAELSSQNRSSARLDAGPAWGALPTLATIVIALEEELVKAPRERARRIALALGDLAGFHLVPEGLVLGHRPELAPRVDAQRRMGLDALARAAAGPRADWIRRWLFEDVLLFAERHPRARRLAALALLSELRPSGGELVLLSLARRPDDPLRPCALSELATWPNAATDRFLVRQLGRERVAIDDPHPVTLLLARIEPIAAGSAPALDEIASGELASRIGQLMLSTDWRQSARGLQLSRGLPSAVRFPFLIESLRVWVGRSERGAGSVRIEQDILGELRMASKRAYGLDPDEWALWWRRVRDGEMPFEEGPRDDDERRTSSFFGLRPISARLTFVIDRSGSMETKWGTTGRSRYEEAIEQMIQYLQASGNQTWFNVILFNRETLISTVGLRRATPQHLELARRSLLSEQVMGGTRLRPAIHQALRVEGEQLDLGTLEADTVIVLCDGQTEEGPAWVEPFLQRYNVEAQVKFHCVLLGTTSEDDGTLRALAERSGGDFMRISG